MTRSVWLWNVGCNGNTINLTLYIDLKDCAYYWICYAKCLANFIQESH